MREPHFQTGDGFLLVFSVASRSSLEYMLKLREFIENYNNCKNLPMLLVGNKCDLESEREVKMGILIKSTLFVKQLCKSMGGKARALCLHSIPFYLNIQI